MYRMNMIRMTSDKEKELREIEKKNKREKLSQIDEYQIHQAQMKNTISESNYNNMIEGN